MSDQAKAIAEELVDRYVRHAVLRRGGWSAPRRWQASAIGHPCDRFLVLQRRGVEPAPPSPELVLVYAEGSRHEAALVADLLDAGVEIAALQRWLEDPDLDLAGKPDAEISVRGVGGGRWLAEIKSVGALWGRLDAPGRLREAPTWWVRGWWTQLQAYLYLVRQSRVLTSWDEALLVLKSKASGQLRVLVIPRDEAEIERLIDRILQLTAVLKTGELPPERPDPELCPRCPYYLRACYGGEAVWGPGAEVVELPDSVRAALERWWSARDLCAQAREIERGYEDAARWIRSRLEATAPEGEDRIRWMAGPWCIEGRRVRRREYTVPAGEVWRVSVVRGG